MKVFQIHQTKHHIRQKNTNYAKKTPNTPKKNTNYAKKQQIRQKTPNTPKKHQIHQKRHQLYKKHQICQKCEFVFQIFIYAVLSRKKFCSKFTHFVGVLFTDLKSMVVYQNGQISGMTFGRSFLADWEALCTTLRLDKIRHRSEETMSNIT